MIVMGAGTNHWFHSDQTYRAMLVAGPASAAARASTAAAGPTTSARRRCARSPAGRRSRSRSTGQRPPRQQPATPFWYLASDQWRYETFGAERVHLAGRQRRASASMHIADCHALAARLGWLPVLSDLRPQPARPRRRGRARRAVEPADYVVARAARGPPALRLRGPRRPGQLPARADAVAREPARLLEQGPRVLPAPHPRRRPTPRSARDESAPEQRPHEVDWRDEAPVGKLDLFTTIDFRMNGSCLYSDVVLPAATWYEKHDLSSTDLHPFVHPFNAAIPPPWEAKTDWDAFNLIAADVQPSSPRSTSARAPTSSRRRSCTTRRTSSPSRCGEVRDWRAGECEPVPGKTMPKLVAGRARLRAPSHEKMTRARAAGRGAGHRRQGRLLEARRPRSPSWRRRNGRCATGAARRRAPVAAPRRRRLRGDPGAVGHDQRPARGRELPRARAAAPGCELAARPRGARRRAASPSARSPSSRAR